jgi:hypothetical protein
MKYSFKRQSEFKASTYVFFEFLHSALNQSASFDGLSENLTCVLFVYVPKKRGFATSLIKQVKLFVVLFTACRSLAFIS